MELYTKMSNYISNEVKIIYIDESLFTRNTLLTSVYSLPKQYLELEEELTLMSPLTLTLAVSYEKGVEYFMITDKSINRHKFVEFVEGIN